MTSPLNFEDVDVPKIGRKSAVVNPFTDAVKSLTVGGKAKRVATTRQEGDTDAKLEARVTRQLADAGAALTPPVTVRRTFTPASGTGKEAVPHTVTFWAIPRIVHAEKTVKADAK